jgi:hypothetical protein
MDWVRSHTPSPVIHQHFSNPVHSTHTSLPVKMEQTECSEASVYKLQTPGELPKRKHTTNEEMAVIAFETWSWRGMLKIKWTDRIMNGVVFQRAKEERLLYLYVPTNALSSI